MIKNSAARQEPRPTVPEPSRHGVALVITLLMLSVITFLAVAFLAVSRRDRSSVTASLDAGNARLMSDAALARAQAEIMAPMLAHPYVYGTNVNPEFLDYDYMVSRNYISPFGFILRNSDTANVNYDVLSTGQRFNMTLQNAAWVQNIANLFYDPRPPVFVLTNPVLYPTNSDFRFWVDINRNGKFETNGYIPTMRDDGTWITSNYWNGEPEWIGVLRDPFSRHSSSNQFIGRYAYLVLPIGKTLDLNYIHNWAKGNYANLYPLTNNFRPNFPNIESDGFARDQGVGSWELNLAGLLDVLSPTNYQSSANPVNKYVANPYVYNPPYNVYSRANTGYAFDDAEAILNFRYSPPGSTPAALEQVLPSLAQVFPRFYTNYSYLNMLTNGIDTYCVTAPLTNPDPPVDEDFRVMRNAITRNAAPWPGSYSTNLFYDPQDLWDSNKTSYNFTNRLYFAEMRTNSFDRYTFQRLLQSIGTSSAPEYGVWVNDANGNPTLRTKVNINWDNTAQIQKNAVYGPMPTNLVDWTPLGFFTNAAELLLRSQAFVYTNAFTNGNFVVFTNYFGMTNIPIYNSLYNGIRYSAQVHRMLQLAANIYEATAGSYGSNYMIVGANLPPVYFPHVYRPQFYVTNFAGVTSVYIIGYTNVGNVGANNWQNQLAKPFKLITSVSPTDLNNGRDDNIWGIPWIIGAVKGLPSFNRYACISRMVMNRKAMFVRNFKNGLPDATRPPEYTNQYYLISVSNIFGMDAWNPYPTNFMLPGLRALASASITLQITNNSVYAPYGYTNNFSLINNNGVAGFVPIPSPPGWRGWSGSRTDSNGFISFQTNVISFPGGYYSESGRKFFTNTSEVFLTDTNQTAWPVHQWSVNMVNYVQYLLIDANNHLLDFVNLGPLISSNNLTLQLATQDPTDWAQGAATDNPQNSPMSAGLLTEIHNAMEGDTTFLNNITGTSTPGASHTAAPTFSLPAKYLPSEPAVEMHSEWVANDPLVHYTADDLIRPNNTADPTQTPRFIPASSLNLPINNTVGTVSTRYDPWPSGNQGSTFGPDMLLKDPLVIGPNSWQFPTNKFPSVGWLGRVHRGTPWQTIYLKPDNPSFDAAPLAQWVNWVNDSALVSYPTNDWALVDLFTAAPNDNAARGLLSVNQTNDPAWAALLSGVIAWTNALGGMPIDPTKVYAFLYGYTNINPLGLTVNLSNSINGVRLSQPNGLFHKVGDILGAATLTTQSPYLAVPANQLSDEMVERIPQQILGLLKVGEPQFVIYAWGESLKPKNLYSPSGFFVNANICTNYEITGEFLSRAVCHIVHTNGPPKFVIDSYNIEPAN